ncbi:MAG: hypothetical protein IPK97_06170 [Ahniella sp.]|nr:hypothetical protein [Ahniella sp.]
MRVLTLLMLALSASGAQAVTRIVTDAGDAGDGTCDATCTLRDAVDASGADDRILFDLLLPNPLVLSLTGPALIIDVPMRITATDGVPTVLRRTGGADRLMRVAPTGDVRIVGLGFEDGLAPATPLPGDAKGGAIYVDAGGALELRDSVLRNNRAIAVMNPPGMIGLTGSPADGGAIYALGDVLMEGCAFIGNVAQGSDAPPVAGLPIPGSAGGQASGGAIFANGTLVVLNSTFHGNVAQGGAGSMGGLGAGFPIGPAGGSGGTASGGAIAATLMSVPSVAFSTFVANQTIGGPGGAGGIPDGPPGPPGIVAGEAISSSAASIINTSILIGSGAASSTCAGAALSQRTDNRLDGAGCPGLQVPGLLSQFEPFNVAEPSPVYRPLLGSAVIDSSPDCLDALGAEAVVLDQLLNPRPRPGGGAELRCDFGAFEATVVMFADGFEDPPPPP